MRFCSRALRRFCCLIPAAVGFVVPAGEARAAEFVVSWVEVQHEVRPRQAVWNVKKSLRLSLQGGNVISENYSSMNKSGQTSGFVAEGKFRNEMVLSRDSQSSWRVQDSNTLVRTWSRPQHTEVMQVSVTEGSGCRATIAYQLKPGFQEYRMLSISTKEPLYFNAVSAENISCRATN